MDSETIHGSVDTDKTTTAKILNNSMSSEKSADISKIMKLS